MMHTLTPDDAQRRQALRAEALRRRTALDDRQHKRLSAAVVAHLQAWLVRLSPDVVGFYWPICREIDLRSMITYWLAQKTGRIATLPVVSKKGGALLFYPWQTGAPMRTDEHGIPCPVTDQPPVTPDLLLIPLNAFDSLGYRLGYGGGYFDRTLAQSSPITAGVGFELGRVDSVLPQPHDIPMQWIVTETGVMPSRPGRASLL